MTERKNAEDNIRQCKRSDPVSRHDLVKITTLLTFILSADPLHQNFDQRALRREQ